MSGEASTKISIAFILNNDHGIPPTPPISTVGQLTPVISSLKSPSLSPVPTTRMAPVTGATLWTAVAKPAVATCTSDVAPSTPPYEASASGPDHATPDQTIAESPSSKVVEKPLGPDVDMVDELTATSSKDEADSSEPLPSSPAAKSEAINVEEEIYREFECQKMPDKMRCYTGQYTKALSRKMISDHFGRNKACTRVITNWVRFCRKHYQRSNYNDVLWQKEKVNLITLQFAMIENEYQQDHGREPYYRPLTYTIQFKKSERDRLTAHYRSVGQKGTERKKNGSNAKGKDKAVTEDDSETHGTPLAILLELDDACRENATRDDCQALVALIGELLDKELITAVPDIEFLPEFPAEVIAACSPASSKSIPTPSKQTPLNRISKSKASKKSRISKKSGVQKP